MLLPRLWEPPTHASEQSEVRGEVVGPSR